jgi:hypothetical protein
MKSCVQQALIGALLICLGSVAFAEETSETDKAREALAAQEGETDNEQLEEVFQAAEKKLFHAKVWRKIIVLFVGLFLHVRFTY